MKKLLFSILLLTLVSLSASAYDFMVDSLCFDINSDGNSATVTYERYKYF